VGELPTQRFAAIVCGRPGSARRNARSAFLKSCRTNCTRRWKRFWSERRRPLIEESGGGKLTQWAGSIRRREIDYPRRGSEPREMSNGRCWPRENINCNSGTTLRVVATRNSDHRLECDYLTTRRGPQSASMWGALCRSPSSQGELQVRPLQQYALKGSRKFAALTEPAFGKRARQNPGR